MGKRGAKPYTANWKQIDSMCLIQCTGEEIASVLGVDYDTVSDACKRDHKMKFSEYIKKKALGGRASLRRSQWKLAVDGGNATMLIWLGKNVLGQKDKSDAEIDAMNKVEPIVIVRAKKGD